MEPTNRAVVSQNPMFVACCGLSRITRCHLATGLYTSTRLYTMRLYCGWRTWYISAEWKYWDCRSYLAHARIREIGPCNAPVQMQRGVSIHGHHHNIAPKWETIFFHSCLFTRTRYGCVLDTKILAHKILRGALCRFTSVLGLICHVTEVAGPFKGKNGVVVPCSYPSIVVPGMRLGKFGTTDVWFASYCIFLLELASPIVLWMWMLITLSTLPL